MIQTITNLCSISLLITYKTLSNGQPVNSLKFDDGGTILSPSSAIDLAKKSVTKGQKRCNTAALIKIRKNSLEIYLWCYSLFSLRPSLFSYQTKTLW